jgi:hypothetical protein
VAYVVHRAVDLSDEVLKSVEAGQRAAIEAVRKFVDTVDEAIPALGDRPSRRETVIDAALDMAVRLVTTQYEFLRSVVRSADRTLRKRQGVNDCRVHLDVDPEEREALIDEGVHPTTPR